MTTWTTISNAAVAVGAIPSSATVTALRDNPSAIAESASGAPVVAAGWHPVDKVTIGDGKAGLIYDFAVNGTASVITTPNFADGWEYRLLGFDMESSIGDDRLNFDGQFETDGFERIRYSTNGVGVFAFDLEIVTPRISKRTHFMNGYVARNGDVNIANVDALSFQNPAQKLINARLYFSTGNFSAGKVYFFRRREYASSP